MRELAGLLTQQFSRTLAVALLHFLWQGALVALLLAVANALLARASARARYAAACAALAGMLALPAVTVWRLEGEGHRVDAAVPPHVTASERLLDPGVGTPGAPSVSADRIAQLSPWIVLGWLAGVLFLSIRLLGGFLAADRLKRRLTRPAAVEWEARLADLAARLRVSQPVRLLESALIEVPAAVGILRPVILLPAGIATGLATDQLDALLAHELAHIRRRDCLVNLFQALAETLLFYHPAVWWVSHRIRVERENACDDLAVAATGDAAAYARALVELEERRQPALRLAVAADGGSLWNRIARLFPSDVEASRAPGWLATVLIVGGMLALGAAARAPAYTDSQEPQPITSTSPRPEAKASPARPAGTEGGKVEKSSGSPEKGSTAAPAHLLSPQQLIAFRIHDVTPEFIDQIIALGYDKASPSELLALRIHGVSPTYISEMTAIFGKLPLEQYTAFRIHGLTPESLKELEASFGKVSADEALAMRIHGVTPEFAAAMRSLGFSNLSADDLLAFRIHGVTPDFVREIRALGYTSLTADELTAFRIHGLSPESSQEMNRQANEKLSADELIEWRIHGKREGEQ